MADEGASSSSNSIDSVEEKRENPSSHFASSFTSASDSCVTSSTHMGSTSQVFNLGKDSNNAASNPFAIKNSAPTRSMADSSENKEARPLLAPPTLKLGIPEAPKIVLRPSALSVQAEKLKLLNKHEGCTKQEGKENSSDESNVAKIPRLSETNGKVPRTEHSDVATSSESPSPSKPATDNPFNLAGPNPEEQASNGGFIFGQNLHERVVNYDDLEQPTSSPTDSHNLTFEEAALKKEELEKMEKENQEEKLKKSLSESAKEYESKQVKRKFDQVAVITGEEEESNVLQINCKLFYFDKVNMNWLEKGRGLLRLNDKEINGIMHSRVVMRIHGSLRVVMNTKVWAGMTIEHPSNKTVRLTAYDPQGVKVFLVMAQPKDCEQLFHAIDWRVTTLKAQDNNASSSLRSSDGEDAISSSSTTLPFDDNSSGGDTATMRCTSSASTDYSLSGFTGADSSSEAFVPRLDSEGVADSTRS